MKLHRHGELVLVEVKEIPMEAKEVERGNNIVVAHSESGHHHTLSTPIGNPMVMFDFNGKSYLEIPVDARLRHQKSGDETHGEQIIAKGLYQRIIKESYSYAAKVMRRVVD